MNKHGYMTEINPTEIASQLRKAGLSNRKIARMLNEDLNDDDAYRMWKKWRQIGRMPKHKMEILNGIIRRVDEQEQTA